MRPTLPYLQQKFDYFNELCFGGQLPQVRLRLSRARTFMGQLRYKRDRKLWLRTTYTDLTISISTYLDLPESEVEDTLIHEMIHLHILLSGLRDTSTHGVLFRAKMREFNVKFGRHLRLSPNYGTGAQARPATPPASALRVPTDQRQSGHHTGTPLQHLALLAAVAAAARCGRVQLVSVHFRLP